MAEVKIVVINGIRYREDDAKRRGLLEETAAAKPETEAPAEEKAKEAADAKAAAEKTKQPANKAATPAAK